MHPFQSAPRRLNSALGSVSLTRGSILTYVVLWETFAAFSQLGNNLGELGIAQEEGSSHYGSHIQDLQEISDNPSLTQQLTFLAITHIFESYIYSCEFILRI